VRYEQLVHCPTSVDLGVLTFRRWLRTRAGGGVPWACEDVLPARGDEDIFDMRVGGWKGAGPTTRGPRPALRFLDAPTPTEGGGPARMPRCALLTNLRWDAHTANCQYCQDAHRRLLWLRNGGLAVGATAVVALPTAEERAAALVAAAALAAALQFVIGLFRRYEFSHAEND
jgi:hypothetical protein